MSKIISFEELRVWQEGHALTLAIYSLTKAFPKEEVYGLTSQLRRAASSVPTNIVEGFYRNTTKEFTQFLYNSRGSCGETIYLLFLSKDLGYLSEKEYTTLRERYENVKRSINALIKSLRSK